MTLLPEAIENHAVQGELTLRWPDGRSARWAHAALRAACPCAECRALRRAGLSVDAGEALRITAIEPVGAYALNLVFADGHRRGIYPYAMLDQPALAALHHA